MEQKPEPENKPLTWKETLDRVSTLREHNTEGIPPYKNFDEVLDICPSIPLMMKMVHQGAKLYGEAQYYRGAREQREICNQPNAPAPEFKA